MRKRHEDIRKMKMDSQYAFIQGSSESPVIKTPNQSLAFCKTRSRGKRRDL
ncbi:hypothetical protein KP509_11G022700 [Ceratopteris richardii]|uniref:Uncharacterized protein n=1 Tax=Ceratopteris richardii TaxID=49495 RepID=A0A8T2TPU1_CERRI|nr:hypothetical protein KP509_11G022700 [Ceratopteris richardii]